MGLSTAIGEIRRERLDTRDQWPRPLTADLAYLRTAMVNLYFSGLPGAGDRDWVLIDAGLPGFGRSVVEAAARRFQPGARPSAIILTHGHFDHVGTLGDLAGAWDAPVFAHPLELPYLTGRSPYAPPDTDAGGGIMPRLSWMFPRGPIDLGDRVRALPEDGSVPFMPGWRWIHTPGHTAGHVSLFRESDRVLIAGDAFLTTPAGIGPGDPGAAAGDPRPALVLHPRLGLRPPVGGSPGRAPARDRRDGARDPDGRGGAEGGA